MAKFELKNGDFRREFNQNPKAEKSLKKIEKYVKQIGLDVKNKRGIVDIVTPKGKTLVISVPKKNNGELKISCTKKNGYPCYKKVEYDGKVVKGKKGIIKKGRSIIDKILRRDPNRKRNDGMSNNQN